MGNDCSKCKICDRNEELVIKDANSTGSIAPFRKNLG